MIHDPEPNHSPSYDQDDFDILIDRSLSTYASSEPRFGLEGRILAQVAAQPAARQLTSLRTRGLLWTGLAAVCLAMAAMVFLSNYRSPEKKQEITQNIPSSRSNPHPDTAVLPRSVPHIERAAMRHSYHPPKPQYGQPQLTQQDRLLIEFAALHHQDALDLALKQQTSSQLPPDQPIASTPLTIEPVVSTPIVIAPIAMDSKDQSSF